MLGGLCSGCSLTEIHRFLAFWTFWRHGRCKERNRMFFCWSFLSVCSSGGADTPQMMLTAAVTVMRLRLTSTLCFFSFNCITPPSGWHHAARNPPDKNVHLCLCISCKSFFKKKKKKKPRPNYHIAFYIIIISREHLLNALLPLKFLNIVPASAQGSSYTFKNQESIKESFYCTRSTPLIIVNPYAHIYIAVPASGLEIWLIWYPSKVSSSALISVAF